MSYLKVRKKKKIPKIVPVILGSYYGDVGPILSISFVLITYLIL